MPQQDSIIYSPFVSAMSADTNVQLPLYYHETYFAKDSLLHPELKSGCSGVSGDPVPYTFRNDDAIAGLLLLCFLTTLVTFSLVSHQVPRQLKCFFYKHSDAETPSNHFPFFLSILTCLQLAITYFFYITTFIADTFVIEAPYILIGIFFGIFIVYFLTKIVIYGIVNGIFWGSKKRIHWTWIFTFITAMQGIMMSPAVILQVYVGISMQNVVYYFAFILIMAKFLTIYKSWAIFFRQKGYFLQIILYLCALEIVPLLILWGTLVQITNILKVTF